MKEILMKKIVMTLVLLLAFSSKAHTYEDFIITNYGFATDGYRFIVDETGYMVTAAIEMERLFLDGTTIATKGQDLTAGSNVELGWDGDYFVVNGNTQVDTMSDNFRDGMRIVVYFKGTPLIKNGATAGSGETSLKLKNSQDAQGPVIMSFIKDGSQWLELNRTNY
jgi:hypothetical protein